MHSNLFGFALGLNLFTSLVLAAPSSPIRSTDKVAVFSSSDAVPGILTAEDAEYLGKINMVGPASSDESMSVIAPTDQAADKFVMEFTNNSPYPITLIGWLGKEQGYFGSINGIPPIIAYSLAKDQKVAVALGQNVAGAFAGVYRGMTRLNSPMSNSTEPIKGYLYAPGQVYNTFAEFCTSGTATIDSSYVVNPQGNPMEIKVGSCTSSPTECSFHCNSKDVTYCGTTVDYSILSGGAGCNSGAKTDGGCQGWNPGSASKATVSFNW